MERDVAVIENLTMQDGGHQVETLRQWEQLILSIDEFPRCLQQANTVHVFRSCHQTHHADTRLGASAELPAGVFFSNGDMES